MADAEGVGAARGAVRRGIMEQERGTERGVSEASTTQEGTAWQRWLHRPETLWAHKLLFHAHQWVGLAASLYVLLMGATGSVLVYLPQVEGSGHGYDGRVRAMEWLADLHENLLAGDTGR